MKRNELRLRRGEKRSPLLHRVVATLFFAALATVVLVLPSGALTHLYGQRTGGPAPLPVWMGISLCWSIAAYGILILVVALIQKWVHRRGHRPRPNMFDDVMDALDRITNGDYNIHVQRQGHYQYSELADKINKLARDLSSMEQMRQEFVSNVSHEIQSPLTSISGFAALLKKADLTPDQRVHYIEVIEGESRRLSKLSDNLLRLSVLDAEQPVLTRKPYRLDKQIEEILLMLEPQWAGKQIELSLDLGKVTCRGDADLLSQVWINLLHNSIKFTPPGGAVAVSLKEEGGEIRCILSDTGSGIPEESLARIFERFYKVDKARDRSLGGNGLGLSLVKKIVELHQGKITVTSKPGEGTAFTVTLPQAAE